MSDQSKNRFERIFKIYSSRILFTKSVRGREKQANVKLKKYRSPGNI